MLRRENRQGTLFDFGQGAGFDLDWENRWIKMADSIPWRKIEEKYAYLFCENNGRPSHTIRLALGALLIKQICNFTDELATEMISQDPYFQYFCGINSFTTTPIFSSTNFVGWRKKFSDEIICEINEMLFAHKNEETKEKVENPDFDEEKTNN